MASVTHRRPRVLVVEDDYTLNGQISGLLEGKGYRSQPSWARSSIDVWRAGG
ncbi:response regulator [Halomonas sp. NO4]|uniref:response regulator n=1 Tax=Halomonas sp. NO4 TaxID=2484813 RepID=UPI0013D024DC|nr:response regulator [Halomonas sp. NO4]